MEIEISDLRPIAKEKSVFYKVRRLARADIHLPELEMTLTDVMLTWHEHHGFSVVPAGGRNREGRFAVLWNRDGVFQKSLAGRLVEMLEEELGEAFSPIKHAA
ncbi:hypothetical protein [Sinorhizobium medicae]|uniref:hypothetical protein n=1 Tax=Sinorhizobium medicae TaxID=110321 RepID=UPI000FD789CD|nr:hypothetical protein [Sinorhizobium medicae]RVJ34197.1 hypothetical protein CN180_32095 [Sinorhizobium medicae]